MEDRKLSSLRASSNTGGGGGGGGDPDDSGKSSDDCSKHRRDKHGKVTGKSALASVKVARGFHAKAKEATTDRSL